MIGRDIVSLLENEARRKPHIAELLERARAGTLSDEEIEQAPVPLPWFRKALKEARARMVHQAALDAVVMERLNDGVNASHGTTAIYVGENCWVTARRGFLIEIKTGDMLFFPKSGGAWLNQSFFEKIPHQLKSFQRVAVQTRQEYVEAYAARLLTYA